MKKLIAASLLGIAVLCFAIAPLYAAVENNKWQVVKMTATGDATGAVPASVAPGRVVKAIRVTPTEASKYYKLHVGTSSGNVIWQTLKTTALTDLDWPSGAVSVDIPIPASGLAVTTDDTTPTIFLYIGNQRND